MRKLARKKDNRELMVRNLVTSLVLYESIETTKAKAKVLKTEFDKIVTRAKKNDLPAKRYVAGYVLDKNAYKKMFEVLIPRFQKRNSGFTRTLSISNRLGDNSEMMNIALLDRDENKVKIEQKETDGKE